MNQTVSVLFGRTSLPVHLPEKCRVTLVEKLPMPFLPAPEKSMADALEHPCGSDNLLALAKDAKSACILICDITRPVPNHLILPPVIKTLLRAGLPADRIRVLVATG